MSATAIRTTVVLPDPRPARGKHRAPAAMLARALVLSLLLAMLVGMMFLDPSAADAAVFVSADPEPARWVVLLSTFGEQVAATAHAITPR